MSSSKLNLLLLPLLIAILFSTLSKLKVGRSIDHFVYGVFTPIQAPISSLKILSNNQFSFLVNMPKIYQENQELKNTNSSLLTENQSLKNLIQDSNSLLSAKTPYKSSLSIRVISNGNQITSTSSLDLSRVSVGQPVISGTTLIGIVSSIKKPIITITPLTDDNFPIIQIKTGLGQTGSYQYSNQTPQVINIPSENPVSLNDNVFTEASDKIPANLVIGKITKILSSAQSPLQKAEIKLNLDSTQLKDLTIIIEP